MTPKMLTGSAVVLVLLLSGCSSGGASRPSADELADAIRAGSSGLGVGEAKADCVADVLVDSDLSDEALRRYTGENDADELSDPDRQAFDEVVSQLEDTCGISRPGG